MDRNDVGIQELQGLGIMKNLVNTIIEKLAVYKSIKLHTTALGIPAYRKLGFQEELEIDRMETPRIVP